MPRSKGETRLDGFTRKLEVGKDIRKARRDRLLAVVALELDIGSCDDVRVLQ